jgi:hypothetical protein
MTPEQIGIPAFLILSGFTTFIGLLWKGTIRLGREYDALEKRRLEEVLFWQGQSSFWQKRAERGTAFAEKATSVAERLVGAAE